MKQELILILIASILIYMYNLNQKQFEHLTCNYPLLSNGVCWQTWDQLFIKN
jgi:hypothetical protein